MVDGQLLKAENSLGSTRNHMCLKPVMEDVNAEATRAKRKEGISNSIVFPRNLCEEKPKGKYRANGLYNADDRALAIFHWI